MRAQDTSLDLICTACSAERPAGWTISPIQKRWKRQISPGRLKK
ncbi:UNVERIFIED_CONTAM: hypothetical protein GTU68_057802 [Idotea baltica]|nr:hypothetical protein [Idotea baltica]